MRESTLLLLGILFVSCSSDYETVDDGAQVFPEKEYYGTVILRNQYDVNDFGSEHYTHIQGSLYVKDDGHHTPITDLSPLISISYIRDDLWIDFNDNLIELTGFENLETVEGKLLIRENHNLKKISAFPNINHIGGEVFISNPELEELGGFSKLSDISSLTIGTGDHIATEISGFDNLTSIEGEVLLAGLKDIAILKNLPFNPSSNIRLYRFPLLTHLDDLSHITEIGGSLIVEDLPNLENINGLSNLNVVKEDLKLKGLPKLASIGGLSSLSIVKGELSLWNLPAISNVDELSNLIFAKYLRLSSLDLITHLDGLSSLRGELEGTNFQMWHLSIGDNPALRDFCGIRPLLLESSPSLYVSDNYYNPSKNDIVNGNCSI